MLFFAYGLGLRAPDEITLGAVLRAPVGARVPPVRSQDSLTLVAPCPSCLRAPGIAPARPIVGRRFVIAYGGFVNETPSRYHFAPCPA